MRSCWTSTLRPRPFSTAGATTRRSWTRSSRPSCACMCRTSPLCGPTRTTRRGRWTARRPVSCSLASCGTSWPCWEGGAPRGRGWIPPRRTRTRTRTRRPAMGSQGARRTARRQGLPGPTLGQAAASEASAGRAGRSPCPSGTASGSACSRAWSRSSTREGAWTSAGCWTRPGRRPPRAGRRRTRAPWTPSPCSPARCGPPAASRPPRQRSAPTWRSGTGSTSTPLWQSRGACSPAGCAPSTAASWFPTASAPSSRRPLLASGATSTPSRPAAPYTTRPAPRPWTTQGSRSTACRSAATMPRIAPRAGCGAAPASGASSRPSSPSTTPGEAGTCRPAPTPSASTPLPTRWPAWPG
mmetsp:Transcript_16842/g.63876  ORF Transcript_16842/g.63876 Transcript_16842/m.63876 type:complete len:355 (-) Transcript_16842:870-1934(-)